MFKNLAPRLFRGALSSFILTVLSISIFASSGSGVAPGAFGQGGPGENATFVGAHFLIKADVEKTKNELSEAEAKLALRTSLEKVAFDLINEIREERGLEPVSWNEEVARVARIHSQSMAQNDYFSHQGIDGLWVNDRAKRNGVRGWRAIGENIAYNRGYDNPAEFAVERWMKSTSHRKNAMHKRWEESGIGVAIGPDGKTFYFTQVFMESR